MSARMNASQLITILALLIICMFPRTSRPADGTPLIRLAERIDRMSLQQTVRALSGADSVLIGGVKTALSTRYTYSQKKRLAARYLIDALTQMGYRPVVQEFQLEVAPPDIQGLAVSQGRDTVWVGTFGGGVYRAVAADGFSAFRPVGRVSQEIQSLERAGGWLWAACGLIGSGNGAVYRSHDGGVTWEERLRGPSIDHLNAIAFADGYSGIVAGQGGTALSTNDGGRSWSEVTPGSWTIHGAAALSPLHYWLAGDGGRLYETTNGGFEWNSTQPTIARLFDIDFSDERHGIAGGDDLILTTRDGGHTWHTTATDEWIWSVTMADSNRIAAAGNNGTVLLSDDGGAVWTELDVTVSGGTDINEALFAGRDTLWVAGRYEIRCIDLTDFSAPAARRYVIADTLAGCNITASVPGTGRAHERILLCGHYDSYVTDADPMVYAPGADDNASGISAILEIARVFKGARLERTVEFALFDSEERGLQGSRTFVERLDTTAVYRAVINLDMIGYDPHASNQIKLAARPATRDSTLAPFFTRAADSLRLTLEPLLVTGESPTSDYQSFWPLDSLPVVLCIEADYGDNPHSNAGSDIAANLDFIYLEAVTKEVFGAVALLADLTQSAQLQLAGLTDIVPNPFHESATITYTLPERRSIDLTVFDVRGRIVAELERGTFGPEQRAVLWNGTGRNGQQVASGIYFVRLRAGGSAVTRKIAIIR